MKLRKQADTLKMMEGPSFMSKNTRVPEHAGVESEAPILRGKLSLCGFEVAISRT
jgi:hypothetical protein